MIVVSDTSPLTAMIQCESEELLSALFDGVAIPEAVQRELLRFHPTIPNWLRVKPVSNLKKVAEFTHTVDRGEAEAIGQFFHVT